MLDYDLCVCVVWCRVLTNIRVYCFGVCVCVRVCVCVFLCELGVFGCVRVWCVALCGCGCASRCVGCTCVSLCGHD